MLVYHIPTGNIAIHVNYTKNKSLGCIILISLLETL